MVKFMNAHNLQLFKFLFCLFLLSQSYKAHSQNEFDPEGFCRIHNCILGVDMDYYINTRQPHILRAYFASELPKNISSFFYRNNDYSLWAKYTDGSYQVLAPQLVSLISSRIETITHIYLGQTYEGELIAEQTYPLIKEAQKKDSSSTGLGLILGIGAALYLGSEAAKEREKRDQEECMISCKLTRSRCVELCTVEK